MKSSLREFFAVFTFMIVHLIMCNTYGQNIADNLSDTDKIFGLSKVWKEADKNFVFFDQVPDVNWDELYKAYIPRVLETESTYAYFKTLQELYSKLNDGHTRVVVPWQLRNMYEVRPALRTRLIGKSVVVTEILNDTLFNNGLRVGMEIVEIDGVNITEYAEKNILPYVFHSTEQDKKVQVYEHNLLRGNIDESLFLKMATGEVFKIDRKLKSIKQSIDAYNFEVLKNNIGYLKITRFWGENLNEKFDELLPQILKTNALIVDVSDNSGGNTGYANYIIKHFVDKPFKSSSWKTRMYLPANASWSKPSKWEENEGITTQPAKKESRYLKPIVVLISEKTYSAGEDFVSSFLDTGRGKLIGRPTAGTTGNPVGFALHDIGGFQVCTKRDYLPNGKEFVGYGISPDVVVKESLDNNILLEQAVKSLNVFE